MLTNHSNRTYFSTKYSENQLFSWRFCIKIVSGELSGKVYFSGLFGFCWNFKVLGDLLYFKVTHYLCSRYRAYYIREVIWIMNKDIAKLSPADIAAISDTEQKLNKNRDTKIALVAYNTK